MPPNIFWLTKDLIVNFRIIHTKPAKDIPAFVLICSYFGQIAVSILLTVIYGMQKLTFIGVFTGPIGVKGAIFGIESRADTPN